MTRPEQWTLVYDGECPLCRSAVGVLGRAGLLRPPVEARAWRDCGETSEEIARRVREELLLWDRRSDRVHGGLRGLLRLIGLRPGLGWIAALLSLPPIVWVLDLGYKTVALNRRVLSPRAHPEIACDCDPPFHRGFCALLWLGVLVTVGLSVYLFGFSLGRDAAGLRAPISVGAGWALAAVFGGVATRPRSRALVEQGSVALALGSLWLLPFVVFSETLRDTSAPGELSVYFLVGGAILAVHSMHRSLTRRARRVGLPAWSPWLWLATFVASLAYL